MQCRNCKTLASIASKNKYPAINIQIIQEDKTEGRENLNDNKSSGPNTGVQNIPPKMNRRIHICLNCTWNNLQKIPDNWVYIKPWNIH